MCVCWLKGVLPDGQAGWVPKNVCQQVEDPQARRQNMKNFLLSEEAQRAYQKLKEQEQLRGKNGNMFPRVHEDRKSSTISLSDYKPGTFPVAEAPHNSNPK
ncbi:unnamed protein product [Rodentolepis nana]|uniref:SH3 domain-containing protein n=1 Tax=Rodentolepis nana TaxID=102285 RepID=A0A0R3TDQ7_RODNA|nr:unnamed protein product [Rodentolepis nana]